MDLLTTNIEIIRKSRTEVVLKYCIQIIIKLLRLLTLFASISAFYNILYLYTGCTLPVYILKQYDMKPVLNNGDLLFM